MLDRQSWSVSAIITKWPWLIRTMWKRFAYLLEPYEPYPSAGLPLRSSKNNISSRGSETLTTGSLVGYGSKDPRYQYLADNRESSLTAIFVNHCLSFQVSISSNSSIPIFDRATNHFKKDLYGMQYLAP